MRDRIFELCEVNDFQCEDFFDNIKIVKTKKWEEFFIDIVGKKINLYHFNYNQEKQTYHGEGVFHSPEAVINYIKRHKNIYDRCNINERND